MIPQNIIHRYSLIMEYISAGTHSRPMMGSMNRNTTPLTASATAAIITKDTNMLFFSTFSFFSPYRSENTAPLPMHSPRRMDVRNDISA